VNQIENIDNLTVLLVVSTGDESSDDSDDENDVLLGCLRGDIVGLQYYKGVVWSFFI